MKISDIIEQFIKEMLEEEQGTAHFQRSELASRFNCVPSQINYVINSRFTSNHGYMVESHRGGGGSIKITRIPMDRTGYLMHIVLSLGNSIGQSAALTFINNFLDYNAVDLKQAKLMSAAVSDKALSAVCQPEKDKVRADILKNMIISIMG